MRHLVERGAWREGPHRQHRVARTDGAEALPSQLGRHLPPQTLVLDMLHATASRWDTATARRGATPPHRTTWVRPSLAALMAGQSDAVITALTAEANEPL
jgi:hypothetical protein